MRKLEHHLMNEHVGQDLLIDVYARISRAANAQEIKTDYQVELLGSNRQSPGWEIMRGPATAMHLRLACRPAFLPRVTTSAGQWVFILTNVYLCGKLT
jgi:hypothetical protein